jgi:Leucine-rich repeat (LRR) protein
MALIKPKLKPKSKLETNSDLDLGHQKLEQVPDFRIYNNEQFNVSAILNLFIGDNNLTVLPDLSYLTNLEILDLANNKLTSINSSHLPPALIELSCKNNNMTSLDILNLSNLVRLDASVNNLFEISSTRSTKLQIIVCSNNKITKLNSYENLSKLYCANNLLENFDNIISNPVSSANLIYLDCSDNNLAYLPEENINNLQDLICSGNMRLNKLVSYPKLKYLEIFNTNIDHLPYMPNLLEFYATKNLFKSISRKYIDNKTIDKKIIKDTLLHIIFS